ncbi:copper transport protein ATOX1 [Hyperolius riggenbachi]|uniref:copper transport protein ATOX1 n=1 Tax=Hyperolius riggenbachi TaxID=752182 RepID=UPI0035A337E2
MQVQEFYVDMTCDGCSNAVGRVLTKLKDVKYDIDLENKKVFITSDQYSAEQLLETLKKTGKDAKYVGCKE